MKLKKNVSLILSITILSTMLPTVSFAERNENPKVTYAQKRAAVENFDPFATQEPFSDEPIFQVQGQNKCAKTGTSPFAYIRPHLHILTQIICQCLNICGRYRTI